jgi:hypothetical protein
VFNQTIQRIVSLLAASLALTLLANLKQCLGTDYLLQALESPVLLRGDATTAYRDPAAIYNHGSFYSIYRLEQEF